MYPYFRWIFTRTFITLSTLSMLLAVSLVASQWKTFYDKLPDFQSFFNWWTIASFWVCLAVREDHSRVRPRPDRQAFRRRSPRDGDLVPGPHAGPLLRRHR